MLLIYFSVAAGQSQFEHSDHFIFIYSSVLYFGIVFIDFLFGRGERSWVVAIIFDVVGEKLNATKALRWTGNNSLFKMCRTQNEPPLRIQ